LITGTVDLVGDSAFLATPFPTFGAAEVALNLEAAVLVVVVVLVVDVDLKAADDV
jgi:hypothetical protein